MESAGGEEAAPTQARVWKAQASPASADGSAERSPLSAAAVGDDSAREAPLFASLPPAIVTKLEELFRTQPDRLIRIDPANYLR